jgi:2-C-methyl-D-erythritol 4-phosphate cytidylyltransferase
MDPGGSAAIVLAAGVGRRIGAEEPKAFLAIGGRTMLAVSAAAAAASPAIGSLVIAAPPGWEDRATAEVRDLGAPVEVVTGGLTRQASVRIALEAVGDRSRWVAVHDAARPFAPPELFTEVLRAVLAGAVGAVPVVPIADTVKRVRDGAVVGTEARAELALAQTPQAFETAILREAHERAARAGIDLTDDAAILEWAGHTVVTVAGDQMNFKITTLMDLALAGSRIGGDGG